MYCVIRLSSKEIYNFLTSWKEETISLRLYYQEKLNVKNLDLKNIYLSACIITKVTKLCAFQFKLLSNMLYVNKMFFKFGKIESPLCSFCELKGKPPYNLFYKCSHTNYFWNQLFFFYLTLLIFHHVLYRVPFLVKKSTTEKTFYTYNCKPNGKLIIEYLKSNYIQN